VTTLLALAFVFTAGFGPALMTDAQEVLEGSLEVIIEDSERGSRTLYFLVAENERIPLRFVTAPRNLVTGVRVRVRGNYEAGGRFVVISVERVPAEKSSRKGCGADQEACDVAPPVHLPAFDRHRPGTLTAL
jgi:hypothetical protein